jgi:transposase-like protein
MASITTELIDTGAKRDGRGRRIVTAQERASLISAYHSSGLTQRVFAEREGIKYSTLTSWLQGRRHAGKTDRRAVFAEVAVAIPPAKVDLSVQLPDGIMIRSSAAVAGGASLRR